MTDYPIDAYLIPSKEYSKDVTVDGISEAITYWLNDGLAQFFKCKEVKAEASQYRAVLPDVITSTATAIFESDRDLKFKKDDVILTGWGSYKITAVDNAREHQVKGGFIFENTRCTITAVKLNDTSRV